MKNKTAIMVPAYNEEHIIDLSIKSFLRVFDEVFVVDDNSSDKTREKIVALDKKEKKVTAVLLNKFSRWDGARNALIGKTDARYVCWLDADDILVKNAKDVLNEMVKSGHPGYRVGLTEMVGDFFHTTSRIFHDDPCHFFLDRKNYGLENWYLSKNGFSKTNWSKKPHFKSFNVPFAFHAKGIKSDRRLMTRIFFRKWLGSRNSEYKEFMDYFKKKTGIKLKLSQAIHFHQVIKDVPDTIAHEIAVKHYVMGYPTYQKSIPCFNDKCKEIRKNCPERPPEIIESLPGPFKVIHNENGKPIDRINL